MEEYEDPEPKGKLILKVGRLVRCHFLRKYNKTYTPSK